MKIALITSCLAGVAHSKMAALAIKKECEKRSYQLCVEEQGGHKIPVKLSKKEIEDADIVIIAKMVTISGKNRFENKIVLDVSVNKAVRNPSEILDMAENLLEQEKWKKSKFKLMIRLVFMLELHQYFLKKLVNSNQS